MASLVEVKQKKPVLQEVTLKLNRAEVQDLNTFIKYWYDKNYSTTYADTYREEHSIVRALKQATEGKADPSIVKTVAGF